MIRRRIRRRRDLSCVHARPGAGRREGFPSDRPSNRAQRDIEATVSPRIVGCGRGGRTVQQGHRIVVAVFAETGAGVGEVPSERFRQTVPPRRNLPRLVWAADGRRKPICTGAGHTSLPPTRTMVSARLAMDGPDRDRCQPGTVPSPGPMTCPSRRLSAGQDRSIRRARPSPSMPTGSAPTISSSSYARDR